MPDEKSPTGEIPSQPPAGGKGGFPAKIIASVFTAVGAPVLVALGVKYADPANWNKPADAKGEQHVAGSDPGNATPPGTLDVFGTDPKLEVTVKQQGKVVVEHTTNRKLSLKPGEYELELSGVRAGTHPSPPRVTISSGVPTDVATWRDAFAWPAGDLKSGKVTAPALGATPLFDHTFPDKKAPPGKPAGQKQSHAAVGPPAESGRLAFRVLPKPNGPAVLPPSDVAVRVTAKVHQDRQSEWGLSLTPSASAGETADLLVTLDGGGELTVSLSRTPEEGPRKPVREREKRDREVLDKYGFRAGPFAHPAIRRFNETNTLLCVVRDSVFEAYVNGVAVCDPIALPVPVPAVTAVRLWSFGRRPDSIDFDRVSVWPAKGVPTPKARGAAEVK